MSSGSLPVEIQDRIFSLLLSRHPCSAPALSALSHAHQSTPQEAWRHVDIYVSLSSACFCLRRLALTLAEFETHQSLARESLLLSSTSFLSSSPRGLTIQVSGVTAPTLGRLIDFYPSIRRLRLVSVRGDLSPVLTRLHGLHRLTLVDVQINLLPSFPELRRLDMRDAQITSLPAHPSWGALSALALPADWNGQLLPPSNQTPPTLRDLQCPPQVLPNWFAGTHLSLEGGSLPVAHPALSQLERLRLYGVEVPAGSFPSFKKLLTLELICSPGSLSLLPFCPQLRTFSLVLEPGEKVQSEEWAALSELSSLRVLHVEGRWNELSGMRLPHELRGLRIVVEEDDEEEAREEPWSLALPPTLDSFSLILPQHLSFLPLMATPTTLLDLVLDAPEPVILQFLSSLAQKARLCLARFPSPSLSSRLDELVASLGVQVQLPPLIVKPEKQHKAM